MSYAPRFSQTLPFFKMALGYAPQNKPACLYLNWNYRWENNIHVIGKQIQCPECEKLFQSKDRLIMHLAKSHALSTPDYTMFSCAECNYKSNSKAYLSFHKKRMHTARPGLGVHGRSVLREAQIFFEPTPTPKTPTRPCQCELLSVQ